MNGKILYTPLQTRCLVLDGAHHLSLDQAAFNPGTGHFGLGVLGQIDADTPDVSICFMRKAPAGVGADWANLAGWWFGAEKANRRLRLSLNDGNAGAKLNIYSDNDVFEFGSRFDAEVRADRAGQARFFVGGMDVGGGAISTRPGSLDNTNLLRLGGYTSAGEYLKGALDLVRLDHSRLLPDAWYLEEWERLRCGCARYALDFLACWLFGDTLIDATPNGFTLAWQGGGDPVFADGWPYSAAPLTYNFEENFNRGFETGYLDLDDKQRAADSSDFTDAAANNKRYYKLSFTNLPVSQQAAFTAAWQPRTSFRFYPDAEKPPAGWFKFTPPPPFVNQFIDRAKADIALEES